MAPSYEVEVKISTARDVKNVNWRHGPNRPYAVLWVDPRNKCSTHADDDNGTNPRWDQTLLIPLSGPITDDTTLYIDVVHAGSEPDTKRLIGSTRLFLRDVTVGERVDRTLELVRPSGRPHGKLDVTVSVRDPYAYSAPPPAAAYAPPPPATTYAPPPPAMAYTPPPVIGYGTPAQDPYYAGAAPSSGEPYDPYGKPAYSGGVVAEEKKSRFGMGTGLAVGAAAGVLGGLALAGGVDYVEDKIAEDAAERVEDDLGYCSD